MENRHVSYRLFSSYSKSCMNGQSHIAIVNNQRVGREKHWRWFSRLPLWKGPTIFRHPDISWFYIPIIYIMPLLYPMIAFFPHPTIMSSWYIPPPDEKIETPAGILPTSLWKGTRAQEAATWAAKWVPLRLSSSSLSVIINNNTDLMCLFIVNYAFDCLFIHDYSFMYYVFIYIQ